MCGHAPVSMIAILRRPNPFRAQPIGETRGSALPLVRWTQRISGDIGTGSRPANRPEPRCCQTRRTGSVPFVRRSQDGKCFELHPKHHLQLLSSWRGRQRVSHFCERAGRRTVVPPESRYKTAVARLPSDLGRRSSLHSLDDASVQGSEPRRRDGSSTHTRRSASMTHAQHSGPQQVALPPGLAAALGAAT